VADRTNAVADTTITAAAGVKTFVLTGINAVADTTITAAAGVKTFVLTGIISPFKFGINTAYL
jgi:uncharacterized protein YlzI (FlbEa/FlbD family)